MGTRCKNGNKEEIFTVPTGKISFSEIGGGAKISYFGQILTPGYTMIHTGIPYELN